MADRALRVGVLGQGRSGWDIHVRWLRQDSAQYKIAAVADLIPARHNASRELGAVVYRDYHDLLADRDLKLDLIVNALPSHLHPRGTIEALRAGHHVLVEKPVAVRVKDFDAMIAAARKARRKLLFFQNSRFRSAFEKIQELLASGKLGKLLHAQISFSSFARRWDWQASQDWWGGNLNNTAPHPLDQAVVLFGNRRPIISSKLASENLFGDADNFAWVALQGRGAPLIEVLVSSFSAYSAPMYQINCTLGGITGDTEKLTWKYYDPAKAPKQKPMARQSPQERFFPSEELAWTEETWQRDSSLHSFDEMCRGLYNDVYQVLTKGTKPRVRDAEVRRQVEILEEVHRRNPLPRHKI